MIEKGLYTIKFSGLKDGIHEFDFDLEEAFFQRFNDYDVYSGTGKAFIRLDKKVNLLSLNFNLSVELNSVCDRCGDDLTINIKGNDDLYVKFGDFDPTISDESLIFVPNDAYQIIVDDILFELIITKLPLKREHLNEEDCNQDAINRLNDYPDSETDSRWDGLKKLLNTN